MDTTTQKQNKFVQVIKKYMLAELLVLAAVIVLDQISKVFMVNLLGPEEFVKTGTKISVIGNWLELLYVKNYGASFGSLEGQSSLFFVAAILGLVLFGYFFYSSRKKMFLGRYSIVLMLGGMFGNAIDRAIFAQGFYNGYVRDFISVSGFAVFNIADCALTVGAIGFLIFFLFIDLVDEAANDFIKQQMKRFSSVSKADFAVLKKPVAQLYDGFSKMPNGNAKANENDKGNNDS